MAIVCNVQARSQKEAWKHRHAKPELVLSQWNPRLCLCFMLYDMRFVNTFIIAMYVVMDYSLFMPDLVKFYAKLNEI